MDWEKVSKLKSRKELGKILKKTNDRKISHLNDVAMLAIDAYPDGKSSFVK